MPSPSVAELSTADDERARRLFRDGISSICHDHDVLRSDIERFRRSGVTAKQVHISCDGQIYADQKTFWSSATPQQLVWERARVGASIDELPMLIDTQATGVFLRSALVAIEHIRADRCKRWRSSARARAGRHRRREADRRGRTAHRDRRLTTHPE